MKYLTLMMLSVLVLASCAVLSLQGDDPPHVHPWTAQERMARALLERHMAPLMTWLESTGAEPISEDRERWYSIAIKPENTVRCPWVSVTFKLDYANEHITEHPWTVGEPFWRGTESLIEYAARVVGGVRLRLWEKMELAFTQDFEDAIETITFGTSHFYRLPTQDSDVSKAKKEDLIY